MVRSSVFVCVCPVKERDCASATVTDYARIQAKSTLSSVNQPQSVQAVGSVMRDKTGGWRRLSEPTTKLEQIEFLTLSERRE